MSYLILIFFLIIPGFLVARIMSNRLKMWDTFVNSLTLSLPISLLSYLPTAFIGSYLHLSSQLFDRIQTLIVFGIITIYVFVQLKYDAHKVRSSFGNLQKKWIKIKSVFVTLMSIVFIMIFYSFVEIHSDSIAHHLMFNYYAESPILTNQMQLKNVLPFEIEALNHVLPNNIQITVSEPTYDFKFYQIIIGQMIRLSEANPIKFFQCLWIFIFPVSILAFVFLGSSIGFRIRENTLLIGIYLFYEFVLKNFFGQTSIGSLPYSILCNYHPTNIVTLILFPICLGIFIQSLNYNQKINYILFHSLFITSFLIHKISFLILLPMTFLFLVTFQIQTKRQINIKQMVNIFFPSVAVLLIYLLYTINLKSIYPEIINNINYMNSSLVEKIQFYSVADVFRNYFMFIENTYYKYLYFPGVIFSFLISILIVLTVKKSNNKSIFIWMTFATLCIYLVPGVHYLVFKLFRSFIQRFFILYNLEIISALCIYFLLRKTKSIQLFRWINIFIFVLIVITTAFDLHRKGNQYARFDKAKFEVFDFFKKNSINTNFIADIDTEILINSMGRFKSKVFGLTQDEVIRRRKDGYQFHEKLNYLLYNNPGNQELILFAKLNQVEYIVLDKLGRDQSYKELLSPSIFNPDFDSLYSEQSQFYKKIFESKNHIVYLLI